MVSFQKIAVAFGGKDFSGLIDIIATTNASVILNALLQSILSRTKGPISILQHILGREVFFVICRGITIFGFDGLILFLSIPMRNSI